MNYTCIYEPLALAEYKESLLWYKEKSEIAAENFVKAVKERIEDICSDPLRYRNTYKYFRETSLKKFPFYIIYFIDENTNTCYNLFNIYIITKEIQKRSIAGLSD